MLTKIVRITAIAAILLGTASASFAAPKSQNAPEPLYFHYATGEIG